MIQGLTEAEFNYLHQKLIKPLNEKKAGVYLFGSRANGKYKKFSDIDLLYVPSSDTPIPQHFIYSLLLEIEESQFPYKIDLVHDQELASSYRQNVELEKLLLK